MYVCTRNPISSLGLCVLLLYAAVIELLDLFPFVTLLLLSHSFTHTCFFIVQDHFTDLGESVPYVPPSSISDCR